MDNLRKPDTITVVVTRADGGVTVMRVVTNEYSPNPENKNERILTRSFEPTNEHIQSIIDKHNWTGDLAPVSWRIVHNDYANSGDRYFRNAWKDAEKSSVEVDMEKAKEIHRDVLRVLREPVLEALDIEYQKADEAKDESKKTEVAAEKQVLRDLPADPRIEAATTPEELKQIGRELV